MRVDFYHLDGVPLERVLPTICERVVAGGERLLIVTAPERVAGLDRALWTYSSESFLPHGMAAAQRDQAQPVLISSEAEATNGARNIALADGRWRDEALRFDRAFYFFDGGTIDEARSSWRALAGRDQTERHYWKRDEGGNWVEGP